jgi:hypothetical protein
VKPLFWNMSAPQRLAFAMGLLSHLLAFVLLLRVGAIASLARLAIAAALIVAAALLSKFVLFDAKLQGLKYDLLIVPLLLAAYWIGRKQRTWGLSLLLGGALSNALVFIPFNPVQRAGPIFAKHDTPLLRALWAKQDAHRKKWLVANVAPGAVMAGLGFRSIRHITITPQVAFFREIFPELPPEKLNIYFNRFAHIILNPALKEPVVLQGDAVEVPFAPFE